jgi:GDSL-like lipase/acylhydrolase family protein
MARVALKLTALVLGGLLIAGMLAEAALRVLGLYSPASFHLLPARSRLRDAQTGWDLTYETNGVGWRDDEYPEEKPAGVFRVAAVGDSFTFGQGCARGTIFPDVLETLLRANGADAQVLNLSSPGLGPEGYLVLLEEALRYRPDVVVVSFCANDASGARPSWPTGTVRELSHRLRLFVLLREASRRVASSSTSGWDRVGRSGALPAGPAGFERRYGRPRTNLVAAALTDPAGVARWSDVPGRGQGWEELQRHADRMAAACRSAGCRLVFAVVPDGAQVDPDQVEVRRLLGVPVSPDVLTGPGRFQALVREMARRLAAESFDPLEEFRSVRGGLYFPLDLHWTPAGHRLYAEALARHLARTPTPARTPGSAPRPPPAM